MSASWSRSRPSALVGLLLAAALVLPVATPAAAGGPGDAGPPQLSGTVTGPSGAVGGGTVVADADGTGYLTDVDSDGAWSLSGLPAGDYAVTAYAPAANPSRLAPSTSVPVTVGATPRTQPLTLRASTHRYDVRGEQADGTTAPAAGVHVFAYDYSSSDYDAYRTHVQRVVTDQDGVASLALGTGTFGLFASPPRVNPDLLQAASTTVFAPGEGAPIVLRLPTVRGVVRTSDDAPAVRATVELISSDGDRVSTVYADEDGVWGALVSAPGTYTLVGRPGTAGPAQARGTAEVVVAAKDGAPQEPAPSTTPVTVRLQVPNVLGRILDPTGAPVAGAQVDAHRDGEGYTVDRGATDDQGRFGLNLPGGTYQLSARPDRDAPHDWLTGTSEVTVVVGAGTPVTRDVQLLLANVVGTVTADGQPARGSRVEVLAGTRSVEGFYTGPDGRFALHVPAGEQYTVTAGGTGTFFDSSPVDVDLRPAAARATGLTLALRPAAVSGTVRDPQGRPVAALLQVVDLGTRTVRELPFDQSWVSDDGVWALDLPPGRYRVVTSRSPFGGGPVSDGPVATSTEVVVTDQRQKLDLVLGSRDALPWRAERVSVDRDGGPADGHSSEAVVSPDGRWVAFQSTAGDLVEETVRGTQVYLRDLQPGGVTRLVSTATTGDVAGGTQPVPDPDPSGAPAPSTRSTDPDVTSSGRYVVFTSDAEDLADPDTNQRADVFRKDLQTGETLLVSRPAPASPGDEESGEVVLQAAVAPESDGSSSSASVSDDGALVAFASDAGNLVPGVAGSSSSPHVYLAALGGGEPSVISVDAGPGSPYLAAASPELSADGSTVVFAGLRELPEDPFGNGAWELVAYDVAAETRTVIAPLGTGSVYLRQPRPSLSASGDGVVFTAADDDGWSRSLRLATRAAGTWTLTSPDPSAGRARPHGGSVSDPVVSPDGTHLAYVTDDGEPGGGPDQVFTQPAAGGDARLVTVGHEGLGVGNAATVEGLASGGATAVFSTAGRRVVATEAAETDDDLDVFVTRRADDRQPPTWPGGALTPSDVGASLLRLSWTAATDPSGVTQYRLLQGSTVLTATSDRTFLVTGLTPATEYAFSVQARDLLGNWTTDGPAVTVSTSAGSGTAPAFLQAVPRPGGVVELLWDAAPGSTGYRVLRRLGGGEPVEVATPAAGTTTYRDTGLLASTTYTYEVRKVVDGTAVAHTAAVNATTPDLTIDVVDAVVPLLRPGLARLGGDVVITVRGEPGRAGRATVTYLDWLEGSSRRPAPVSETATLTLTEVDGTPGTYRGVFAIADGVREISTISAVVTDGAGHDSPARLAPRLPVPVAGALALTLTGAPDAASLAGARVSFWSDSAGTGAVRTATDGVVVADLLPADDWRATVVSARGDTVGSASGLVVTPGLRNAGDVAVRLPATLSVSARDRDGQPVAGSVTAELPATGESVGWGYVSGDAQPLYGRITSGPVRLRFTPQDRDALVRPTTVDATLGLGTNTVDIVVEPLPQGTVGGVVTRDDSTPVEGATVVAEVVGAGGRTTSRRVVTAPDGAYSFVLPVGEATVRASAPGASTTATTTVTDGSRTVLPLVVNPPRQYVVDVRLTTRLLPAAESAPLSLDWRTAVHYSLTVRGPGGHYGGSAFGAGTPGHPNSVLVTGNPGDPVTLCANGHEAGVGSGQVCVTATLGEDRVVPLVLRLGAAARLTVPLRDGQDQPYTQFWQAVVERLTDGGAVEVTRFHGHGASVTTGVPRDGRYRVTVTSSALADGGVVTVAREADLADGESAVTTPVVLARSGSFTSAVNAVTATAPASRAGALVDLRAAYRNDGTAAVTDAVLRLAVPRDTTFAAEGLLLDGAPATATPGDGYVDVTLPALEPGSAGLVRYQLRLAATTVPGITAAAAVRRADGRVEQLRPAMVTVERLTLDAPESSLTASVPLGGTAPPGVPVRIYDGTRLLTSLTSTPGGFYRGDVVLPPRVVTGTHLLHAETGAGPDALRSRDRRVRVEPTAAVLTQVALSQEDPERADGRRYAFDPRKGVARFPFVFVPYQRLNLDLTFDVPDRVSNVVARLGALSLPADRQPDGTFRASTVVHNFSGPISADWDVAAAPVPLAATTRPTVEQVREDLPPGLRGFTVVSAPAATTDPDGTIRSRAVIGTPDIKPGSTMEIEAAYSEAPDFVPSAEDLANQRATGAAVYGMETDVEVVDGDLQLTLTAYVPRDQVVQQTASGALRTLSAGPGLRRLRPAVAGSLVRAAALPAPVMKLAVRVSTEAAEMDPGGIGMTALSFVQGIGAKDKYGDLSDIVGSVRCQNLHPALMRWIDAILKKAVTADVTSATLGVVAALITPATAGVGGVAVGIGAAGLGAWMDSSIAGDITRLKESAARANANDPKDCSGPPPPGGDGASGEGSWDPDDGDGGPGGSSGPVGSPTVIYDPSGYVYETVASDRIPGVTAVLFQGDTADGPWHVWDADWFGQANPLTTDGAGRYAWDVPEGWWKVQFVKDGWLPAQSASLRVLPPQLDVNIPMVRSAAATLTAATSAGGGLDLAFDQWMRPATVTDQLVVTGPDGATVAGSPSATGAQSTADGPVAKAYRFVPTGALVAGTYTVRVGAAAQDAARRPLTADAVRTVVVTAPPAGGGAGPGGGDTDRGGDTPTVPPTTPPATSPPTAVPSPVGPPRSPTAGAARPVQAVAPVRTVSLVTGRPRPGTSVLALPAAVPAGTGSVVVRVVGAGTGDVLLGPAGVRGGGRRVVTLARGRTATALAVVPVGAGRRLALTVRGPASALTVDVVGAARATSVVVPAGPARVLDTARGIAAPRRPLGGPRSTVRVTLPVLPVGTRGVVLAVAPSGARGPGWVGVSGAGSPVVGIPYRAGAGAPSAVVVPVDARRQVVVTVSGPAVGLAFDVIGTVRGAAPVVATRLSAARPGARSGR